MFFWLCALISASCCPSCCDDVQKMPPHCVMSMRRTRCDHVATVGANYSYCLFAYSYFFFTDYICILTMHILNHCISLVVRTGQAQTVSPSQHSTVVVSAISVAPMCSPHLKHDLRHSAKMVMKRVDSHLEPHTKMCSAFLYHVDYYQ